jgi:hypothetical protein
VRICKFCGQEYSIFTQENPSFVDSMCTQCKIERRFATKDSNWETKAKVLEAPQGKVFPGVMLGSGSVYPPDSSPQAIPVVAPDDLRPAVVKLQDGTLSVVLRPPGHCPEFRTRVETPVSAIRSVAASSDNVSRHMFSIIAGALALGIVFSLIPIIILLFLGSGTTDSGNFIVPTAFGLAGAVIGFFVFLARKSGKRTQLDFHCHNDADFTIYVGPKSLEGATAALDWAGIRVQYPSSEAQGRTPSQRTPSLPATRRSPLPPEEQRQKLIHEGNALRKRYGQLSAQTPHDPATQEQLQAIEKRYHQLEEWLKTIESGD